jgi:hypothetical protein
MKGAKREQSRRDATEEEKNREERDRNIFSHNPMLRTRFD